MLPADPLEHLPTPDVLRDMIAEHVNRTELLRQMLRLSLRREALQPSSRPGVHARVSQLETSRVG